MKTTKTTTTKTTPPAAAKSTKTKTAAGLRDLPPQKDPRGGRKTEEEKGK